MNTAITLDELTPSEIVGIKMDRNRILHIWFNYPILNADVDYEVALYIAREKLKFEAIKGKCLGLFVDITNYNRLDCVEFFDITIPSPKVRQMHSEMHKDAIMKRAAYCKKNTSRVAEVCVKMASMYYEKEVRLFSTPEKAIKWLEEGIQLNHPEAWRGNRGAQGSKNESNTSLYLRRKSKIHKNHDCKKCQTKS